MNKIAVLMLFLLISCVSQTVFVEPIFCSNRFGGYHDGGYIVIYVEHDGTVFEIDRGTSEEYEGPTEFKVLFTEKYGETIAVRIKQDAAYFDGKEAKLVEGGKAGMNCDWRLE